MNPGLVQNACRKAVVVGAKCADRYQSSILAALESAHPELAIRPIEELVLATMKSKVSGAIKGEFEWSNGCFQMKGNGHCFRMIPLLNPFNARLKSYSIGALCSFHRCDDSSNNEPLVAAAYLGGEVGVLHGSTKELVLRSNYRILRSHLAPDKEAHHKSMRLGVGTEEDWQGVPMAIRELVNDSILRPVIGSPLRVLHALVRGQIDAAVFHIENPHLNAVVQFFLNQAMVERTEVRVHEADIAVHGQRFSEQVKGRVRA
jgi:hypothetical protein